MPFPCDLWIRVSVAGNYCALNALRKSWKASVLKITVNRGWLPRANFFCMLRVKLALGEGVCMRKGEYSLSTSYLKHVHSWHIEWIAVNAHYIFVTHIIAHLTLLISTLSTLHSVIGKALDSEPTLKREFETEIVQRNSTEELTWLVSLLGVWGYKVQDSYKVQVSLLGCIWRNMFTQISAFKNSL